MGILLPVMKMKNNKEMLASVLKTTQMGQIGIRSVLDLCEKPDLRAALEAQLQEYDAIECEAHGIAARRGWDLPELDPAVHFMTDMMTRMKIKGRNSDSRTAEMMIMGNIKGMVKSLKNLHRLPMQDALVTSLAQKLLDSEIANIRQMEGFL